MNGREVFKFATRVLVSSAQNVLAKCDLSLDDVDVYVPHQANVRIIDHALAKLGIPKEKTIVNVDRYGNTSSASIPLALAEAVSTGRVHQGDTILMTGMGAGLTWGSAVMRWTGPVCKLAFCFPGQGSLAQGMGRDVAAAVPEAMEVYERGSAACGLDLKRLCFESPLQDMVETEVQQPALVATSLAMLAALRTRGIIPDYVIGHSVGEFAAIAAAKSVGVEQTIALVRERGLAMAEAAKERPGSMAAILGLDDEVVERLCRKIFGVWPANYNCPGPDRRLRRERRRRRAVREGGGGRRAPHGQAQGLRRVPFAARRPCGRAASARGRVGQVRRAAGGVHVDGHGAVRGRAADGLAARRPADRTGALHAGGVGAGQATVSRRSSRSVPATSSRG